MISGIPSNIVERIDNGARDSVAPASVMVNWEEPTATDNSGVQTLTSSHASGSLFPVGDTEVTYTSTDQSGNVANQTFTVTVTSMLICYIQIVSQF